VKFGDEILGFNCCLSIYLSIYLSLSQSYWNPRPESSKALLFERLFLRLVIDPQSQFAAENQPISLVLGEVLRLGIW